jgi:hypothetical protein
MDCKMHPPTDGLPEYVSTSIGPADLGNMSNRLRDMAALLASQDLGDAAEHLLAAYGCMRAKLAALRAMKAESPKLAVAG